MRYTMKLALRNALEEALDNIAQELEENRFYSSVLEAGTAPKASALDTCRDHLDDFLRTSLETAMGTAPPAGDVLAPFTLKEITEYIISSQEKNLAHGVDELSEVDTFIRDAGERKYEYFNTVYRYLETGQYIAVEEQRAIESDGDWAVVNIDVISVEKREKVTYEWS